MEDNKRKYKIFILGFLIVLFSIGGYFLRNILLEEDRTRREIGKYNVYAEFYNNTSGDFLGDFAVYYKKNFMDNKGSFRILEKVDLIEINSVRQKILLQDPQIEKIDAALKEKPEFKNIDVYIREYVDSIKEERAIALKILDYYEKSFYNKDEYEGGMLLHALYVNSARTTKEKYSVYVGIMKNLIKNEKQKEIKRLEKKNRTAAIKMVLFINDIEEFSRNLFLKGDFKFNREEITRLKELYKNIEVKYKELKKVTDMEVKKDRYLLEHYNKIREYSGEIALITGNLVERLEAGEEVFPLPYEFSVKYNDIISEYNIMIGNKK